MKCKKCYYGSCGKNSIKNPDLKFFKFPKNNLNEWIHSCDNDKLNSIPEKTLLNSCFVCELHFERTSYSYILTPFKKRLKVGAVPIYSNLEQSGEVANISTPSSSSNADLSTSDAGPSTLAGKLVK